MNETLIEVKNIRKTFVTKGFLGGKKENEVLRGISLQIKRNETLALVGESGCGKTTLGRIILGVEHPTDGEIYYEGKKIHAKEKADSSVRRNMQMVFQDPFASLDPKMRIEDILLEPLLANKVCKKKKEGLETVKKLLETVGLREEHMRRYPYQFSGGQRQRIGIARALAVNPAFIICDEPVSALDVSVQAQILNLLKKMKKEKKLSLLFISHDLGVVRYIADRVVIMYLGKICEMGPVEEIYGHPRHPYTEYLMKAVPKMRVPTGNMGEEKTIQEANELDKKEETACPFYTRCLYRTEICQQEFPRTKKENGTIFYCHHPL